MYDPERFDAEIILDRMDKGTFTTEVMQEVFGCSRMAIQRAIVKGKLPKPRKVEVISLSGTRNTLNVWDREQVIDVLVRQMTTPKGHPKWAFA